MRLGAAPQADTGHQIQGNGFARLATSRQAVWAGIFRGKSRIALNDVGVLYVPVPILLPARRLGDTPMRMANRPTPAPPPWKRRRTPWLSSLANT
jgi:hypothetical protein